MPYFLPPLLQIGDIFNTLQDFSLVIQIIVFTFILFQLYSWLADQPLLFGGAAIIAAYLVFFYSIFTTFIAALILVLFTGFGYNLQNLIYFGVTPLARSLGVETPHEWGGGGGMADPVGEIEQKLAAGKQLSDQEANLIVEHYKKQQDYEQAVNKLMLRRGA